VAALTPAERETVAAQKQRVREIHEQEMSLVQSLAASGKLSWKEVEERRADMNERYSALRAIIEREITSGKWAPAGGSLCPHFAECQAEKQLPRMQAQSFMGQAASSCSSSAASVQSKAIEMLVDQQAKRTRRRSGVRLHMHSW
jgi:hypothetical protein